MKRRRFLQTSSVLASGMVFNRESQAAPPPQIPVARSYSLAGDTVGIHCERIHDPVRITMMTETHLSLRDARDDPWISVADDNAIGGRRDIELLSWRIPEFLRRQTARNKTRPNEIRTSTADPGSPWRRMPDGIANAALHG